MAGRLTSRPLRAALSAALVTAVVTCGVAALAPAAHAATDTAAPQLVGTVGASPSTVDITAGDATTTISVRLTDDLSGVASATVTLTSPQGWTSDVALDRTGGTTLDGTWTGPAEFSGFDPTGAWPVAAVTAYDRAGNTLTATSGLGAGPTVVRTSDTTAPTLLDVSADLTTVDTTAGPADVTLTVRARDDLSGVGSGEFEFTSPDGDDTAQGYLTDPPSSGTPRNGTWTVDVTFPARSAPGAWTLTHAEVADGQYNTASYDAPGRSPLPAITVTVVTDDDTAAPQLTGFTVGPSTLSTGYQQSGYVYARVAFVDTGSGLASATVTLRRPDGSLDDVEPGEALFADSTARSGTSRSGSLVVGVWTDFVATGTWSVASVVLTDLAGNQRTYVTAELGSRATFVVSAAKNDTLSPSVTGLAFSPSRLDVRAGPADGVLLVGVKDPDAVPAGFASGTVRLTSPSGAQVVDGTISAFDLADGDTAVGTFRGSFTIDQGAEDGPWRVTALALTDGAAHTRSYTGAELTTALGGIPTLTVTGSGTAVAPSAPATNPVTLSGTTATLTWTPPTDDGGAPVTGYVVTPYVGAVAQPAKAVGAVTGTTITGLAGGRTYTFTVAARNAVGTGAASAASNAVTVPATTPGAPAIGAATIDDTTATVRWTAPTNDGGEVVTGYVVTPYLGAVAQPPTSVGDVRTATVDDLARGRTYTFRVAAVNALGTGALSAASTSVSVAATPTALTLTSTRSTVTYGDAVAVSGVLTRSDTGDALADQTVRLQYRADGGAWTTAPGSTRTTSSGVASFAAFRPASSGQVRLVAQPDPAFAVATSPARTVAVRRSLSLATDRATITHGHAVTLSGRLTPADPGTTVRLQRLVAGTWRTVASDRVRSSAYSFTLRLRTTGTRTFRVLTAAAPGYAASTSSVRTVHVR